MKDNAEVTAVNAEEKNTFALSVLRRIKMKLDGLFVYYLQKNEFVYFYTEFVYILIYGIIGREPDVLRKATVAEQVDFIIREATNVDNLALLYEGNF